MAKTVDVDSVVIENGFLQATVKVGSGEASMGARLAFKLEEHPNLKALIPMINAEVANSVRKAFGAKELVAANQ